MVWSLGRIGSLGGSRPLICGGGSRRCCPTLECISLGRSTPDRVVKSTEPPATARSVNGCLERSGQDTPEKHLPRH